MEQKPTYTDDEILEKAKEILDSRIKKHAFSISHPDQVKDYLRVAMAEHQKNCQEVFSVIFLDSQHNIISTEDMFFGSINSCSVYPREIVKRVIALNANAVIFAHNHPSGNSTPSAADKRLADTLQKALDLISVRVLDNFIVGDTVVAYSGSCGL